MAEVSATEAQQIIDSGAQLIDVRTGVEYEAGHIPGARHIPVADVQQHASEFSKDEPVVVYCRAGNRSGPIGDAFVASGFDAHSIEGGIVAWSEAGLPVDGTVVENPNMPPR